MEIDTGETIILTLDKNEAIELANCMQIVKENIVFETTTKVFAQELQSKLNSILYLT